jgi:hypothetical protein
MVPRTGTFRSTERGELMNRKASLALLALATCVVGLFVAAPAGAITDGARDTVHTHVGLVRFTTTDGRFRCSGTLISQTVILTAGHCTEGPATDVLVSFDTDLALDPLAPGITPGEKANRRAHYIAGTAHPDPGWTGKLSFAKQHDQGVVVLAAPASSKWPDVEPAQLPPVGFLNRNQGKLKNETFTLVGYGVDIGDKKAQIVISERRSTTSYLQNVGREVVTFQINDRDSKAGGGSCFGDSGGAVFWGPYVLGDASYVNSLTCNATGSYQRDDTTYSRNFLNQFLP